MPVPAQSSVNVSVANGVTTVFPYQFKVRAASDLLVLVDDVPATLTTDYTVSGVGVDNGGNVTFIAAPANGAVVVRMRNMPYSRSTDYQQNGDLLANTLDADQDDPVMMIQQLYELLSRTPTLAPGTTLVGMEFPPPGADEYIKYNAAGTALETAPGTVGDGGPEPFVTLTSVAGVLTIDWSLGTLYQIALTQNITSVVFSGLPSSGKGQAILVRVTQHASSAFAISGWPAGVEWFGTDYAVSTTLGATDLVGLTCYGGGSQILGNYGRADDTGSGVISRYEHTQSSAATTWTINHNLGRHVITKLFDATGKEFIGEIQNTSSNQTVVTLDTAMAGYSISI